MNLGDSREFTATEIIIDTQLELMLLVKGAVRNVVKMLSFRKDVEELIEKNLADIKNEDLREVAKQSLTRYAYEELEKLNMRLGLRNIPLAIVFLNSMEKNQQNAIQKQINEVWQGIGKADINYAYSQLGNSMAKVSKSQSLYGHSELVARFEEKEQMLADLRKETNLVICSTHSDCSERCSHWQGKVYSLDGTSGFTGDGRRFEPLENATNVIDKYGYKNGLLGFNCRHKLVPFKKGLKPIKVDEKERKANIEITGQQRAFERQIRHAKEQMFAFKGVDNQKYLLYKKKVQELGVKYRDFCIKYNRVQYRSRLQVNDDD